MFEGFISGGPAGGQLTTTTDIENFPGFPEPIGGMELVMRMREQAVKYGTKIISEDVESIDLSKRPFVIKGNGTTVEAMTLIIATGATARRMGVPGEAKLWSRGVSACAVCDGGLPIFRNKELAVIGGGDSAIEEAVYLTNFASKVYIVHRRDKLRASAVMQKRAETHPKIEILWNNTLVDVKGDKFVESVLLKDVNTNAVRELPVAGLFYAIGHVPNTSFLNGQLELYENGYIKTSSESTLTSVKGVFACGDVQDSRYRQAVSAAGSGCMAAIDAQKCLEGLEA
jgi:thioredoxin reductase (NADPH)